MTPAQKEIFDRFTATGRTAHYRPRKGTISINGFRPIPVNEAISKMKHTLANVPYVEVNQETTYGRTTTLPFSVRVF